MESYKKIVRKVLDEGEWKFQRAVDKDGNKLKTLSTTGYMFEHNMFNGFPLLTTKKMGMKMIAAELGFFIKGLSSKSWLQERNCSIWDEWCNPQKVSDRTDHEAMKEEDYDEYQHVYLGIPNSDDDSSVIKRSWIEACIDAHIKLNIDMSGSKTVGYDVADSGEDRNCAILFDGAIATKLDAWKAGEDELDISSMRAYKISDTVSQFTYDSIGVGAGVGAILKNAGLKNYSKFNAGGEVFKPTKEYSPKITNKEKFENIKAQAWWDVADRMRNTFNAVNRGMKFDVSDLISISSDVNQIEILKSELSAPHKDYSKRGKDMVESKKEVKKRLEKSHDLADAFIMAACPHLVKSHYIPKQIRG